MDLLVVAVGRSRDAPIDTLFAEYARRCPWPLRLVEVQPRGTLPPERRKAAEADLLLARSRRAPPSWRWTSVAVTRPARTSPDSSASGATADGARRPS